MGEAMPASAGRQLPIACIGGRGRRSRHSPRRSHEARRRRSWCSSTPGSHHRGHSKQIRN
jgi:hypothetical protein